jgi:sucrose-6-phosphate hydrolase SacC (GH32 family)
MKSRIHSGLLREIPATSRFCGCHLEPAVDHENTENEKATEVCTTDFVQYEDLGEVLAHGDDDAQDQFVFAGSLFAANGVFYAMYTGFNRNYPKQGKASQVLMIATSTDLINWNKTSEKLVLPQEGYDPTEWRAPFVFWSEDTQEYVLATCGTC